MHRFDTVMRKWVRMQLQRRVGIDVVRHPSTSVGTINGVTLRLLRELNIDCVLDVGANVGQFGTHLRTIGYAGPIVSFEPVLQSFEALSATAAGDLQWRPVHAALGSNDGTAHIKVTAASVLSSLRQPLESSPAWLQPDLDVTRVEDVQLMRLDTAFEQVTGSSDRTFLKLDTQGWDLEVLEGATDCLRSILAIQSELSIIPLYEGMPTWMDSLRRLQELGFSPTWMSPVTLDGAVRPIELDCIFLRG